MEMKAKGFLEDLKRNVREYCTEQIDFETYNARQRKTWAAIQEAGPDVKELVLRAVREELPTTGPRRPR